MPKNIKIKIFLINILKMFLIIALATIINILFIKNLTALNKASEIYILSVLLISLNTTGYFWGILSAFIGVLCTNYFFTYPYKNFNFTIEGYPVTFFAMLTVAVATSTLSGYIKKQREFAREKTRLTEERQKIIIEAEKEKMRSNLLRAISHDIRTPLTGILGATSALIENDEYITSENRKQFLLGIHDDAEWLLRMVENVLSVTKISDGSFSLRKIAQPIDEVFSQVSEKAKKRYPQINLKINLPQDVILVPMDEMLIVQVLVNLIDNAIIHGKNNNVELCAKIHNQFITIHVIDYGCGILPENLENIFDGFNLKDKISNDTTRGLGIGLSICKSIVEAHDGQIKAENLENGGACISFTLPTTEVNKYG